MKKNVIILAIIAVIVFGLIFGVVLVTQNWGKKRNTVSVEAATKKLDSLYSRLNVNKPTPRQDPDFLGNDESSKRIAVLPDISEYPFIVNPTTDNFLTIYSSLEKTDWLIDIANKFNQSGATAEGKPVSVGIRAISSSLGAEFISSGKYTPDAYAPANEIYGDMLRSQGVHAVLAEKRIAGNVAGVVITRKKYDDLTKKHGSSFGSQVIIDSVISGELALGYTTPLSNEDGFNFILTLLMNFDPNNPLSDDAIEKLRKFQDRIPFISYDNDQLKASLTGGNLDAIILNYQAFINSPNLKSLHEFIPIGFRQDNPVYEIGQLPDIKKQIIVHFIDFCKSADSQQTATVRGFNSYDDYSGITALDGTTILKAQEIYENEKNGSSDLTAVFVADTSGSMEGSPLLNLKASLNRAIGVINSTANVGLITFSDDVNILVPIARFDNYQRSYFSYAIKSMSAGGGTAMFDAIVVAQKMLMDAKARNPGTKLMLFVLTDGEANLGYGMKDIESMSRGIRIPIYTIGYNANIDILQDLSNINEAATMNADSDNVIYRLESLFNAQM